VASPVTVPEASSPSVLKLKAGDRPLRTTRETAPDASGGRPDRPPPDAQGNGTAYSLGALPGELGLTPGDTSILFVGSTGARITHSRIEKNYFVSREPADDLKLPALQAKNRRDQMGFEVLSFTHLPTRGIPGISDVKKAEEILALALARQLSHMDFPVKLKLNSSMAECFQTPSELSARAAGLESTLESVWKKLDFRWELSGSVRFWTVQRKKKDGDTVTAYLALLPEISVGVPANEESGQAAHRKLYHPPPIFERETLAGAGSISELRREAVRRVLDRAVRRLLGTPELERTLVSYIQGQNAAKSPAARG